MKKSLTIIAAIISLLVLVLPSMPAEDNVYPGDWSDYHRGLGPEDLSFSPYKDTYLSEGMYIQIRFDDGTFMFGSFFIYKVGPYWRYGIMFTHVDKENNRRLFKEEVPDAKVEQSGPPFLWRLNKNFIKGDGDNWRLVISAEGIEADLHFKRLTPGWKPGNGRTVLNEKKNIYFWNVILIPAARVSGSIRIDGKPHMADGYGYIDRGYQNQIPTHFAPVWLSTYSMPDPNAPPEEQWFFHFTDNYGHRVFNKPRYGWLILIRNDKIMFATKDFVTTQEDWRMDPSIGEKTPFRFVINGRQGDDRLQLVAQGDRIVDSLDVFSMLPLYIKKVALKFLKRPVYFRLNSTVKGTLHQNGKSIPFETLGMSGSVYIK